MQIRNILITMVLLLVLTSCASSDKGTNDQITNIYVNEAQNTILFDTSKNIGNILVKVATKNAQYLTVPKTTTKPFLLLTLMIRKSRSTWSRYAQSTVTTNAAN